MLHTGYGSHHNVYTVTGTIACFGATRREHRWMAAGRVPWLAWADNALGPIARPGQQAQTGATSGPAFYAANLSADLPSRKPASVLQKRAAILHGAVRASSGTLAAAIYASSSAIRPRSEACAAS